MQYVLTLPTDPVAPTGVPTATQSFNFQLHPAFWFGMAMCDTQSSPRPLGDPANPINPGIACTPDSDTNITTDSGIASHPGTAFMEMQFYPPGWTSWPRRYGSARAARCTSRVHTLYRVTASTLPA